MSVNLNICMEFKIVSHFYIIQELSIDLFLYQALFQHFKQQVNICDINVYIGV